jgi:alcohol dehydrogenase (cytochrome c)
MTSKRFLYTASVVLASALLGAQGRGLDPADLLKPLGDQWPTYSGDYSGKRYSSLKQINQTTVKSLTLAWTVRLTDGPGAGFGGRGGGGGGVIVGGEGKGDWPIQPDGTIKGTPLMVNDTIYVTTPDNGWALDARDGRELWHYFWKTRGGTHIANRGFGMWKDYLYMETPDNYLVSLEAKTGKERWHKEIASFNEQYFSTMAPIVVGNHVIAGTGNDLDTPGFLQSFDPETGALQWKLYTVPMNPGDPGLDTWPSLDAARHGGAQPWLPGVYDPETKLYIFGTGNPTPAFTQGRGEGDNLFTSSLVAVNVDTGKMAWYFQTSPHDMHDWDSAQTPILFDAVVNGKRRKLVSTAARNGYFYTVDRVTGEHLVTTKYGTATNWGLGLRPDGTVKRNNDKNPSVSGSLVSPTPGGTINWEPPAYNPDTGLFYVTERNGFSLIYLTETDPRGSMGLGGVERPTVGGVGSFLTAIDPRNGKVAWRERYPFVGEGGGGGGLLTTAGGLVFGGDAGGNIVAYNATTGKPIWHSHIGNVTNPPITYMVDGRQHLLVAANNVLYAFVLYDPPATRTR